MPRRRSPISIDHPNPDARRPGVTYTTFEETRLEKRAELERERGTDRGADGRFVAEYRFSGREESWASWSKRNVSLFKAFSDTDDRFVRFLESQYEEALANPNGTAAGRFFDRLIPQKLAARIGEMAVGDVTGEATDAQMGKRLLGELERRLTSVVGADALEVESAD